MASHTPTPRDSNGAWLEQPRDDELKTVEDYKQASAFLDMLNKKDEAEIKRLNVLNKTTMPAKLANLKEINEDLKKQERGGRVWINELAMFDRSWTLEPNRLEACVCTLLSMTFA